MPPAQGVPSEYLRGLSIKDKVWERCIELFHRLAESFTLSRRHLKYEPLLSLHLFLSSAICLANLNLCDIFHF